MEHAHEKTSRSIAKAVAYRVLILISDSVIIFAFTHNYKTTLGVIFFSNIASTLLYFFHERAWNKVEWGRVNVNK